METVNIIIEMEDGGVMKGELYPEIAPISVENFLKLIDQDFFAGLIFHRVIPGFMIQGGGYDKDFNHHEADSIKGEFRSNGVANDLLHTRGVLSMARQWFLIQHHHNFLSCMLMLLILMVTMRLLGKSRKD